MPLACYGQPTSGFLVPKFVVVAALWALEDVGGVTGEDVGGVTGGHPSTL